jgi:LysR family transcriptional regulator, carnitine catabolism transcriptional activator
MDFFSLRCFVEIVRAGSFTRAAEALGRSQPAVSSQVRKLEDELGGVLFDRSAPSLALTERGRRLLPRVERLLEDLGDMERELTSGDERPRGRVTMAAGLAVIEGLLPPLLGAFRAVNPLVRLSLLNRPGEGIYRALVDGRADLGLGYLLADRVRIASERIGRLGFFLVIKKGKKGSAQASAKSLLSGPLLAFEKGIDIRNYIEGKLGPLETSLELPSVGSLLGYAERGFGPAIVPIIGGGRRSAALEWIDLGSRIPPLSLEMYTRQGAVLSQAASLLAETIRNGSDSRA